MSPEHPLLRASPVWIFSPVQPLATAVGGTIVSGTIGADTIWTLAGSPYTATSYIDVQAGVALTIEPGVEVRFTNGSGLVVDGRLSAAGTPAQPITFTSAITPTHSQWGGVYFYPESDSSRSILEYVTINFAGTALTLRGASPTIRHTTFFSNFEGINAQGNTGLLLTDDVFLQNGTGLRISGTGAVTITRCLVERNGAGVNVWPGGGLWVNNSVVRQNSDPHSRAVTTVEFSHLSTPVRPSVSPTTPSRRTRAMG